MSVNTNEVVATTRVRFARNIKGLPFPHRLRGEEEIYSVLMKKTDECCRRLFKGKFYKTGETDKLLEQSMVEKHLISQELSDKPYGAVFVSDDESVSVMINEEDHIREQCILGGYKLEAAYRRLSELDALLGKELDIAFDPYFGYLTACPTNLGAAMRTSVMVFLPALTLARKMRALASDLQNIGFTVRGVYGEGSESEGFEYQISNQAAVGKSEEEILSVFDKAVARITELEKKERLLLKASGGIELQDKIMRSYGILTNCCTVSSAEFTKLMGYVKLGASLGYINKDPEKLDRIVTLARPAMLCILSEKKLSSADRDKARAALAKKML